MMPTPDRPPDQSPDTTLPAPLSWWADTAHGPDRRDRPLPIDVDVVVVGAGIVGLTAATRLLAQGRSVLVLEARNVAGGVSGHTTAKVTAQHSLIYDRLTGRFGAAVARTYGQAQLRALAWIVDQTVGQSGHGGIDADLVTSDSYVFSSAEADRGRLAREADAAQEAGMPASYVTQLDLPFPTAGAVRFTGQARFHPRKWLLALADRIEGLGGQIIERVRVTQVHEGDPMMVESTAGQVRAAEVIIATHYPILDRGLFFTRLEPVRDLVICGIPAPEAAHLRHMYLDLASHHSIRPVGGVDGRPEELIVLGEHYRTGERLDVEERYEALAAWARERLGIKRISHRWSAQDVSTTDGIPFVGRYRPRAHHLWVGTGFGQWGMTGGTAAGLLLSDLIQGTAPNDERELFDPHRFDLRTIPALAHRNSVVAAHLVGDMARASLNAATKDLGPGQAEVCRVGTSLVAAYKDGDEVVHAVSAHCTHLGCVLAFNNAEQSWDCPCHSSRFDIDGAVLNGPAVAPLKQVGPPPAPPRPKRQNNGPSTRLT